MRSRANPLQYYFQESHRGALLQTLMRQCAHVGGSHAHFEVKDAFAAQVEARDMHDGLLMILRLKLMLVISTMSSL